MSAPPDEFSPFTLLRSFPTLFETDLAKARLADADIPAVILNELSGGLRGIPELAPRPFELLVPSTLVDEAAAILSQPPDDPADVAPPADDEVDPLDAIRADLRRSVVAGVAGLFLSGLVPVAIPLFCYGLYLAAVRVVPNSRDLLMSGRLLLALAIASNALGLLAVAVVIYAFLFRG